MFFGNKGRVFVGMAIVVLGVLWLTNNIGLTDIAVGEFIGSYWPIIVVLWGIDIFINALQKVRVGTPSEKIEFMWGPGLTGLVILLVGISLLARNLDWLDVDFSIFWKILWPLILILAGISFLKGGSHKGRTHWAFMSGLTFKTPGWKLQNSSYVAFMGGIDLDMTVAEIPEGETIIDLTAVMGAVDIKVPSNVNIICNGTAVLGSVEAIGEEAAGIIASKTMESIGVAESNGTIRIYGRALMGGIDIKRV